MVEFTGPWESNMELALERKMLWHSEAESQYEDHGWTCQVFHVKVGF